MRTESQNLLGMIKNPQGINWIPICDTICSQQQNLLFLRDIFYQIQSFWACIMIIDMINSLYIYLKLFVPCKHYNFSKVLYWLLVHFVSLINSACCQFSVSFIISLPTLIIIKETHYQDIYAITFKIPAERIFKWRRWKDDYSISKPNINLDKEIGNHKP